jgi:hypothetical protein
MLDLVSDWQLLEKSSDPWSYLVVYSAFPETIRVETRSKPAFENLLHVISSFAGQLYCCGPTEF